MINIKDDRVFTIGPNPQVVNLQVFDKIRPAVNTKEAAEELENELRRCGYETRTGQNVESGIWSVAIIGRN